MGWSNAVIAARWTLREFRNNPDFLKDQSIFQNMRRVVDTAEIYWDVHQIQKLDHFCK